MKKKVFTLLLALVAIATTARSQNMMNGHEYVDLGLPSGTLWATCNVGANSPEEYGDYFAWGEITPKKDYSWSTYELCNGSSSSITKYTGRDGKNELDLEDDAAYVNWGSNWRMPSLDQIKELIDNCDWDLMHLSNDKWGNKNYGYKVTSKTNGKFIILPCAGFREDKSIFNTGVTNIYWLRSLSTVENSEAFILVQNKISDCPRWRGHSVRPVCSIKQNTQTHEYVDLGLLSGTLWATCNVGANAPEEAGDYFAWGETAPKSDYSWETYKWCKGSSTTLTKYCTYSSYGNNGFTDNKTELDLADDAAYVNWGKDWRMPSYFQIEELKEQCQWTPTTLNGVDGYTVTGCNGNSIFLPKAGYRNKNTLKDAGSLGEIWSRSFDEKDKYRCFWASYIIYNSDSKYFAQLASNYRTNGLNVRPVRNIDRTSKAKDYVDLGLPSGTLWATCNIGANIPEEYGDYFAWGETQTKDTYTEKNHKWGKYGNTNKYPDKRELDLEDDAAYVNWGKDWRMPRYDQLTELVNKCKWNRIKYNGVTGYIITGPNGNSIFLPCAGKNKPSTVTWTSSAYYWSRSLGCGYIGQAINFDSSVANSIVERISYDGISVRPVRFNGQTYSTTEYVDLGLPSGTLWATKNIGADTPEEFGDIFAWGETKGYESGKKRFDFDTYQLCKGSQFSLTKYCQYDHKGNNNYTDDKIELDLEDDAAYVNWGSDWRMPSADQIKELTEECTWKWTISPNGVRGCIVIGPNEKTIFLPAVDERKYDVTSPYFNNSSGVYWSRSLYLDDIRYTDMAYTLYFNDNRKSKGNDYRPYGYRVRPVQGKSNTGIDSPNTDDAQNKTRYNLNGQRVGNDYKGIVIQNGKKRVVK